jgi:hypothetical protein
MGASYMRRLSNMEHDYMERNGISYVRQGDYYLPALTPPAAEQRSIGVWGQRRRRYLKERHRVLYYDLLTCGKLCAHLADVEEQANDLFLRLVEKLAKQEGVTEQLKASDPMAWVRRMNNIRNRVTEIVNSEIIEA